MAEAFDARELAASLDDVEFPADDCPKTINDLPKELLVSVFEAVDDLRWVRHTVPCVCKEWAELYRSQDASPLHETLEVHFRKELESTLRERLARRALGPRRPAVHASRVISWTERRAGWVRKLHLEGGYRGALEDFSSEDLGRLVAVAASSLTEIYVCSTELKKEPFWKSWRASVEISSLKKLEELMLRCCSLSSLPKELGELSGLASLDLSCNVYLGDAPRGKAFPAELGKMKSLTDLDLSYCGLRAVPAFVGELESLEFLNLGGNEDQIYATLDPLIKGCPRLREVRVGGGPDTPESEAHFEAFKAKLLAKNPNAEVTM